MEYMDDSPSSDLNLPKETILCCDCGIPIQPNPSNCCLPCLRQREGVANQIPKQYHIYFCRNCERYLQPPNSWVRAALESRELLALCLKKVKGIDKSVRLVDAGFVWTEPHSKRIKIKITIQKEVTTGAILQEKIIIEFIVNNQMCEGCHRVEAKDFWRSSVQIRQKTPHKKTLFYLEQLILKHKAHVTCSNVKQVHEGLDFYYQQQQDARKFVEFLETVIPCRTNQAKELVSHDPRNNTYNYKRTFSVEIVPLCKDHVICLNPKLANQLGGIGQICVVYRVTSSIYLIDPSTCKSSVLSNEIYWRNPVTSFCQPKQLIQFIVMHIEVKDNHKKGQGRAKGQGAESLKHILADVWVSRSDGIGLIHTRTHLGHLLKVGDLVKGYDMKNLNYNDENLDKMNQDYVPDVILIKKIYNDEIKKKRERGKEREKDGEIQRRREWKLKHLEMEDIQDNNSINRDFNDFLDDLEEDKAYRHNVNIYKASNIKVDQDDEVEGNEDEEEEDERPRISLAEMIDDMQIE